MNKKILSIFIIVLVLGLLAAALYMKFSQEDGWICVDGEWMKRGEPSGPKPTTGCEKKNGKNGKNVNNDLWEELGVNVKLISPLPGEEVKSPLTVVGEAKGTWFFEASFPVRLEDSAGNVLASHYAQAEGEWMTEEFVPFKSEFEFISEKATDGFLILEKDNPSGLPEHDRAIKVPVKILPSTEAETITVKVYFNNSQLDPDFTCVKVFAVERKIPKTLAVARAAIEELLKGPSEKEREEGYMTSLPSADIKINSLVIENKTAKIDFSQELQEGVGGSCRVSAIRAQIEETLKQFPTVDKVIISIDGETEDILQP